VDYNDVLSQIVSRDHRDANRAVGPLSVPPDAIRMDTTALTQDQVVDQIVQTVQAGRSARSPTS
jgi:cytidylate kinase